MLLCTVYHEREFINLTTSLHSLFRWCWMASTSESCLTAGWYCLKNYAGISTLIYEAYWTYLLAQSLANFIPTLLFWNELIQFPVPKWALTFNQIRHRLARSGGDVWLQLLKGAEPLMSERTQKKNNSFLTVSAEILHQNFYRLSEQKGKSFAIHNRKTHPFRKHSTLIKILQHEIWEVQQLSTKSEKCFATCFLARNHN